MVRSERLTVHVLRGLFAGCLSAGACLAPAAADEPSAPHSAIGRWITTATVNGVHSTAAPRAIDVPLPAQTRQAPLSSTGSIVRNQRISLVDPTARGPQVPGAVPQAVALGEYERKREAMTRDEWQDYRRSMIGHVEGMARSQIYAWFPSYGDGMWTGLRGGAIVGTSIMSFAAGDDVSFAIPATKAIDFGVRFDRDSNLSLGLSREVIPERDGVLKLEYEYDERTSDNALKLLFRARFN